MYVDAFTTKMTNSQSLSEHALLQVLNLTHEIVEYKIGKENFPTGYGSLKQLDIADLKALYDVKTLIEQFCWDR